MTDPVAARTAELANQIREAEDDLVLRQICDSAMAALVDDGSSYLVLAVRDGEEPAFVAGLVRGHVVRAGPPGPLRDEAERLQGLREVMES